MDLVQQIDIKNNKIEEENQEDEMMVITEDENIDFGTEQE